MTLHDKQWLFMQNVAKLIAEIDRLGYTASFGEALRTPEQAMIYAKNGKGIKNSLHLSRLAIDINLFKNGVFLQDSKSHEPFGIYWESLNQDNKWGGKFNRADGNHYQMDN